MERLENKMLMESIKEHMHHFDFDEDFNGAGRKNLNDGTFVREEDAFDYAIDHCIENAPPPGFYKIPWTQEFKDVVIEWFYSGGEWKKEN